MSDPKPMTEQEIRTYAKSAVWKIDALGRRGATLCSIEEIEAMAMMLVASGQITQPEGRNVNEEEKHDG